MDLHNILLGTDFSPSSEAAMQCAAAVAKRFHSSLFVAHVISESLYAGVPSEILAEAKTRTVADLRGKLEQIRSHLKDIQPEIILEEGSPSEALLRLSETKSIDLLVVGTQGHTRIKRLLLGSVSEKLSRQARCPVLVTPEFSLPNKQSNVRTILCPTNFSERSVVALQLAWRTAKAFSGHIILLHVVEAPGLSRADRISRREIAEEPMARLSSSLSGGDRSQEAELTVGFGPPASTILELASERNADLIVLSIQRAKAVVAHLPPEITFSVAAQAPCPVLILAS